MRQRETIQEWPVHECPPWCHACPLMVGGSIMPMCYGSVVSNFDEFDISACTCTPSDPALARTELAMKTATLIRLLRDKRRQRQMDKIATKRLKVIVASMKFWTRDDIRRCLPELESVVQTLNERDV